MNKVRATKKAMLTFVCLGIFLCGHLRLFKVRIYLLQ